MVPMASTAGTGWPRGRARDGGIDEIPLPDVAGRLWLCGKHAIGPDVDATLVAVGASTVVCLTERHELVDRYPEYVAWLEHERGRRALWHPIPDLHAPTLSELEPLVDELVGRLATGEGLVVHCGAGIGRAGTVAVCLLVSLGVALDDALDLVAAHRPMAGPEVGAQRDVVTAHAARRSAR
jgi:protein-tyrosine phosphatase